MPYKPVEIEFISCIEVMNTRTKEECGIASVTFQLDVPAKHRGLRKGVNDDATGSERLDALFEESLSATEWLFYTEFLLNLGESTIGSDIPEVNEFVVTGLAVWVQSLATLYLRFLNAVTVTTLQAKLYPVDEGLL